MPRRARAAPGGICYHVLNRGNERQTVFHNDTEYASFVQLIARARNHQSMRVLAYCLMPNHFHLCLWPFEDGDLGEFMKWLMSTHVSQYRKARPGSGHIWQGRYKSFAAQDDAHLLKVLSYIERNPVRARLVQAADQWPWSSAARQSNIELSTGPIPKPPDWLKRLGVAEDEAELAQLRASVNSGQALDTAEWLSKHANLD
ncbi:REP-associated tyrosine transposase [uncultured bacterium]|nr:REP-associated tyrosine transposase [uncultured bacterium]